MFELIDISCPSLPEWACPVTAEPSYDAFKQRPCVWNVAESIDGQLTRRWVRDPTRLVVDRDQESRGSASTKSISSGKISSPFSKIFGRNGGVLRTVVFHECRGFIDLPRRPPIFPCLLERVSERLKVFGPVAEPHVHDDGQSVFGAAFRQFLGPRALGFSSAPLRRCLRSLRRVDVGSVVAVDPVRSASRGNCLPMMGPSQCGPHGPPAHDEAPQITSHTSSGPQAKFPAISCVSAYSKFNKKLWGVRRELSERARSWEPYLAGLASMPAFSIRTASSVFPALFVQTNARYLVGAVRRCGRVARKGFTDHTSVQSSASESPPFGTRPVRVG
jgi:hypothetical protein